VAKKANTSLPSLVIVESPAKAKTIERYLGSGFKVKASMGHVRDLPAGDMGIDIERGFEPVYQILAGKQRVIKDLRQVASKAERVYLATDPDREGEAIAWHLVHALDLDPASTQRVVFNEITESAVRHAFAHPHHLDMDKVNAQQARRLLDRIVGYELSPLLQQKITRGLSAGRVQSVAVRLIVEREREIRAFVPEESWRVFACFTTDPANTDKHSKAYLRFVEDGKDGDRGRTVKERNRWLTTHGCLHAELVKFAGKDFGAKSFDDARGVLDALAYVIDKIKESDFEPYKVKGLKTVVVHGQIERSRAPRFTVRDVQKKRTTSKPNAPFTTAALQQAASTNLGFGPSRTMRVAQQLYEGIELGSEGSVGLITYMRTDSTNLSKDSIETARGYIKRTFGDQYLPDKANVYTTKKRAQEAHEAVRPTDAERDPESVRKYLSPEQFKLYDLIWRRFVACQMPPAQWDNTTIIIGADTDQGEALFRTGGRRLVFDGFLKVMGKADDGDVLLPEIEPQAETPLIHLDPQQQYTAPPPRYSEAALVKKLEAEGIGRPSTYAAIIQTVQDRGYVELLEKRLRPTELGEVVTDKLTAHFPEIMDVKFTSFMEEELDKIEESHLDWVHVLGEFYDPFKKSLDKARTEMERTGAEPSDYKCEQCGRPMVYRFGKNGRFLACSGYPECKNSKNVDAQGKPVAEIIGDVPCPECGRAMVMRRSRMGPFLGCTGYPECSSTMPCDENGVALRKVKAEEIDEECPECHGKMSVKWARGRSFLGCSNYPKCKATKPMPSGVYVEKPPPEDAGARCDKCGRPMVIRRSRRGPFLSCSGFPRCRNAMPLEKLDELKAKDEAGEIPDPPAESNNGKSGGASSRRKAAGGKNGKVDLAELGPPPPGFAWTRTGRPVVETWPEEPLTCPECGREVTLRNGRFGPYYGCSGYPKCSFVANLRGDAKKRAEVEMPRPVKPKPIPTDVPCDECGEPMLIRTGRTGPFLGCSKYPKCRFSKPLPEGETAESLAATNS
jgi:DNA topoisomerase I